MKKQILKPIYPCGPIKTIDTLRRALGLAEGNDDLLSLCLQSDHLYITWEEPKKNGKGTRPLCKARPPLDAVQSRIKSRLLDRVNFPTYLQGGVRDVKGGVNLDHFGGAKVDQLVKG